MYSNLRGCSHWLFVLLSSLKVVQAVKLILKSQYLLNNFITIKDYCLLSNKFIIIDKKDYCYTTFWYLGLAQGVTPSTITMVYELRQPHSSITWISRPLHQGICTFLMRTDDITVQSLCITTSTPRFILTRTSQVNHTKINVNIFVICSVLVIILYVNHMDITSWVCMYINCDLTS